MVGVCKLMTEIKLWSHILISNSYTVDDVVLKDLEGKESYLFKSDNDNCFKYLLLMEPTSKKAMVFY